MPELIQVLNDTEEVVRDATNAALSEFGNRQTLENGSSVLSHARGEYIIPGTTTGQSSGLSHVPLFRFTNQARLDFLRTAVGDVYTSDGWLDTNTRALPYASGETIKQIDASGSPLTRISSMRGIPCTTNHHPVRPICPAAFSRLAMFLMTRKWMASIVPEAQHFS